MNRWLLAKIFPLFVANLANSPATCALWLDIACDLRLDLKDFISPSIRPRINQRVPK